MSNRRFIEIYSAHRNREQYPIISDFEVPYAAPRVLNSPSDAYDPITTGPVYYTWIGGNGTEGSGVATLSTNIGGNGTLKTGTTDSAPLLIPTTLNSLSSIIDYYLGFQLNNTSTLDSRIIRGYSPADARITPATAFVGTAAGNTYTISDPSTSSQIHIPAVDLSGNTILDYAEAYRNCYIIDETATGNNTTNIIYRKIISYDFTTRMATLESAFPVLWTISDKYTLRKDIPLEKWTVVGTSGNVITLNAGASSVNNFYVGKYIYDTTTNKSFYIRSYNGATKQATVNNSGASLPGAGAIINIVAFVADNFVPLIYNGSVVSQSETVCYEISLINLSLPNVTLKTGSRPAFYPYFYVELTNVTSPSGASKNIIYSNNPDSNKALFIAPVTDISQPVNSSFLKIDGGAMTQTVKFKPNDTLKFSVFLPDGKLFEPVTADYLSPYPPNLRLQIDAVFAIKRL